MLMKELISELLNSFVCSFYLGYLVIDTWCVMLAAWYLMLDAWWFCLMPRAFIDQHQEIRLFHLHLPHLGSGWHVPVATNSANYPVRATKTRSCSHQQWPPPCPSDTNAILVLPRLAWCLMRDAWCLMLDAWCLMLDAWCCMLNAWFMMRDARRLTLDAWCLMLVAWCLVLDALMFDA